MKNRYEAKTEKDSIHTCIFRVIGLLLTGILTFFFCSHGYAQQTEQQETVSGVITDASNSEPLPGVNVSVRGTNKGASTDENGSYTLSISSLQDTLVFSFIGFRTDEVPINGRSEINIELQPQVIQGQEMVVVGYGQQRQRDLTGSISTVSADEVENILVDSPEKFLQGKVAGVHIVNNSGQPGSATTFRIRGGSSINAGNSPLFIIDGVPFDVNTENSTSDVTQGAAINPLSSINPDDIESISVLKDASATAIYGARGSNGVVLINTKSGRSGKPRVNISTSGGFQRVRKTIPLLNAKQFAQIKNQAEVNSGGSPIYTDQEIASLGTGTDWQNEIFRNGTLQDYNLSVSGGDQSTQYFLSGKYGYNQGTIIGSDFEDYNVRLNLNTQISNGIKIGDNFTGGRTNSNIVRSSTGSSGSGTGIVASALYMNPIQTIYNPDGTYVLKNDAGRDFPNPVASAKEQINRVENARYVNNFFVEINPVKNVEVKSSIGLNILNNQEIFFKPNTIFLLGTVTNQAERGNLNSTHWINTNTVRYNTSFGGESNPQTLKLLGGFTIEGDKRETTFAGASDFPNNRLEANDLSAGAQYLTPRSSSGSYKLVSYLARANYTFNDKYILTANARLDGSSRFGKNNKYGFFPSGAIAWRLSNEDFMKYQDVFSDLKLRISYGKTGNQDIGNYQSLSLLNSTSTYFGEQLSTGFAPSNLGNSDLKWETTTQFDAGLDMALWNGALSLTADYYSKTTNDLLFSLPLPTSSGFSSTLVNLGEVQNKGFEFSLATQNISFGETSWDFSFNIASNQNKVTDLGSIEPFLVGQELTRGTGNTILIKEGLPIGAFYGRVFNGMDQNGEPTYKDLNGDGKITDAGDRKVLGEAQPDFSGGITSKLHYKNFEFSFNLNYVVGNKIFNVNRVELELPNGFQNNSTAALDYWTPNNTNTIIPKPTAARGIIFDDRFLEDGSYLRFQNITLAYNLPSSILNRLNIKNMRIYVSGENLITITDYSGYDPEVSTFGQNSLSQGIDFGVYPTAKTYRVGLKLGF